MIIKILFSDRPYGHPMIIVILLIFPGVNNCLLLNFICLVFYILIPFQIIQQILKNSFSINCIQ